MSKEYAPKMSHWLTITKKKQFSPFQLQVLKNYVQKKGHGDKKVHKKQTYSHNIFDETSAN